MVRNANPFFGALLKQKHLLWLTVWVLGLGVIGVWDLLFLNQPAFILLRAACINTVTTCFFVIVFSIGLGWLAGLALNFLENRRRMPYFFVTFVLNIIRSVPQIVGVLLGYIILTILIEQEIVRSQFVQLLWMALTIGLFVFLEVVDLIRERISYYTKLDFFQAMLCCGIPEWRIINREILWKNSRAHFLHKIISIFGIAIFLQCSIDFVVSVGLSSDVSLSNFPATLGSQLAKLDSKQDILAVGRVFLHPLEAPSLVFEHLQGISIAVVIVFTLLCMYQISNGLVKRYDL